MKRFAAVRFVLIIPSFPIQEQDKFCVFFCIGRKLCAQHIVISIVVSIFERAVESAKLLLCAKESKIEEQLIERYIQYLVCVCTDNNNIPLVRRLFIQGLRPRLNNIKSDNIMSTYIYCIRHTPPATHIICVQ